MNIFYVDCIKGELLKDRGGKILYHSFSELPFRIQKIVLTPNNSSSQDIIKRAKERLKEINFNPVDSSGSLRDELEIKLKSFCGLIVEQLCFSMLKHYNKNPSVKIELDNSGVAKDQIDLKIHKSWQDKNNTMEFTTKTIEIRSSFPFKPIEKVVSEDFDILGSYKNNIKKDEIEKDFYLRFLYSLEYESDYIIKNNNKINYKETTTNVLNKIYFDDDLNLKRDIVIYFIGGATNSMMTDKSISYDGTMSSSTFNQDSIAKYRKLKVRNALDCIAIMQMMLNVITTEAVEGK